MLRLASRSLGLLSQSLPGIAQKVFNPTHVIQQCMNFSGINRLGPPLLTPITSIVSQVCGFKVKARLRRRCKDCYFVVREERLYVICKTHPRHKQMKTKEKPHNTWILTHASQSPTRPW